LFPDILVIFGPSVTVVVVVAAVISYRVFPFPVTSPLEPTVHPTTQASS
jgi:hypothetical protein